MEVKVLSTQYPSPSCISVVPQTDDFMTLGNKVSKETIDGWWLVTWHESDLDTILLFLRTRPMFVSSISIMIKSKVNEWKYGIWENILSGTSYKKNTFVILRYYFNVHFHIHHNITLLTLMKIWFHQILQRAGKISYFQSCEEQRKSKLVKTWYPLGVKIGSPTFETKTLLTTLSTYSSTATTITTTNTVTTKTTTT